MGWGRKSRFFGTLSGKPINEARVCGDTQTGLQFSGGGWDGFIEVRVHDAGDEDWVRVVIIDHPFDDQKHCVELYAGPLNAKSAYKYKKQLRRRRALNEAKKIVAKLLNRSETVVPADMSEDNAFYLDELEVSEDG